MRVLLLSNLYPPYVQGEAEIVAKDIVKGLISYLGTEKELDATFLEKSLLGSIVDDAYFDTH